MTRKNAHFGSFGHEYLTKNGWNSGSGLGKSRHGNPDPIKVKLKHDTAGIGHEKSAEFTDQWWDHVFNKAAAKVSVISQEDGVHVKSEQELSQNKKDALKRKILYGSFVKGTTLEAGTEIHESNSEDPVASAKPLNSLTDEELFQACGGRTAHKGARHGFKLNGKLQRVEEQDAAHGSGAVDSTSEDELITKVKKSKKSKKRNREANVEEDEEPTEMRMKEPSQSSKKSIKNESACEMLNNKSSNHKTKKKKKHKERS